MVFRNGGYLRCYETWHYQGLKIEVVNIYKYLGAYLTPTISWTKTQDILSKQGNKAIAQIYKFQKRFGYFQHQDAFRLFDKIVLPFIVTLLKYGNIDIVIKNENVHTSLCKLVACLNRNVANLFALSECGRYPLYVHYMTRLTKYWLKLSMLTEDR